MKKFETKTAITSIVMTLLLLIISITTVIIVDVDRMGRSFTTISDGNFTSIIRFNVPQNTPIINRMGRNVEFNNLLPGMRVEVRHANFMTASIPPQTTALEVKIL